MENKLYCPECGNEEVLVASIQKFRVNSGEYFCESVKISDFDSPANCLDCGWKGERQQLDGFVWN